MSYVVLKGLRKSYGSLEVIKGLDLEIAHHQFTVLLGPSGCGKSTTLRLLAGLEPVSAGEIHIDGRDVTALEPRERDISMVFQNYALYPNMSVEKNLGFGLKAKKMPAADISKRVREVAALLGITELLARKPGELSGGQQQRVAIGRAIVREPKVFLFDEPLSNLDAKLRAEMRAEILRLHRRLKATTVYVTHDQEEAMTMADRIVIMNAGNIEQEGTPDDIFFRPATRMVAGFIGSPAMNFLSGVIGGDGRISTPVGSFDCSGAGKPGQKVEVGIRPDDLLLGASDNGETRDGGFTCEITLTELLGPRAILHLASGDGVQLQSVVPHQALSGLKGKDSAVFRIRNGALHVFDARTGRALRTKIL